VKLKKRHRNVYGDKSLRVKNDDATELEQRFWKNTTRIVHTIKQTQKQQHHAQTQYEPIFSFFTRHVLLSFLYVGGGEKLPSQPFWRRLYHLVFMDVFFFYFNSGKFFFV
jgi:hypothetical protein